MSEDQCIAKKMIEETKKLLHDQNVADKEITETARKEWANKLKKDLCCIFYKYKISKWSWRKFDTVLEISQKEEQPEFWELYNDNIEKVLCIVLPKIRPNDWLKFAGNKTRVNLLFHHTDHVLYKLTFFPNGEIINSRHDSDHIKVTYEDFFKTICSELAEYSLNIEYGHNPRK